MRKNEKVPMLSVLLFFHFFPQPHIFLPPPPPPPSAGSNLKIYTPVPIYIVLFSGFKQVTLIHMIKYVVNFSKDKKEYSFPNSISFKFFKSRFSCPNLRFKQ